MEKFEISPDDCLILKAFRDSRSLREAAQLLREDPAGLTRKVQQISNRYGFLQKVNNRWQVTSRGLDLVAWVETSIQSQKKVIQSKNNLRIASTMWFSEEILVPWFSSLKKSLGENLSLSLSVPNKNFELALMDGSVDFVVVCHPPENPEVEHRVLGAETWVLIAPRSWAPHLKANRGNIKQMLQEKPFIRHSDLNTDLFFPDISEFTDADVRIDNLVGIRAAVCEGLGWSLVPEILVHRSLGEGRLIEIPYQVSVHDRKICLWWLRNRSDSKRQSVKIATALKSALSNR
jgi:DNA-binding transcriptional LysR family regulator